MLMRGLWARLMHYALKQEIKRDECATRRHKFLQAKSLQSKHSTSTHESGLSLNVSGKAEISFVSLAVPQPALRHYCPHLVSRGVFPTTRVSHGPISEWALLSVSGFKFLLPREGRDKGAELYAAA